MKQVNQQVKQGNDPRARRLEQQKLDEKKRKELDRKKQAEIDSLFRPAIVQKIDKGLCSANYINVHLEFFLLNELLIFA